MQEIIEKVDKLKEDIEDIKTRKAQAEGKKETLIDRLKEIGIVPEKAKEELEKLNSRKDKIGEEIKKKFTALQEIHEW